MESLQVYDKAYKEVEKLMKNNTTEIVTIDYSKLDERTAAEIRLALRGALQKRKNELWATLSGVS